MIYGFYHGSYPDICVNHGKKDVIQWEWYFKPLVSQKIKQSIKKSAAKKTNAYLPAFKDIYSKRNCIFGASGIKICSLKSKNKPVC